VNKYEQMVVDAKQTPEWWNEVRYHSKEKKTNHILHLLLTVITVGFWIPVWIYVSYSTAQYNANIGSPPRKPYVLYGLAIVVMALALVLTI